MEGIKEAIAFITGLAVKAEKPEVVQINGRTYCTKDLRRYDAADKAKPIKGKQGLWNWDVLLLRHKGRDSWDRPVYEDETGKLWKDVEPRADDGPKLCSALYNAFDGEPDTPLEVMERYKDKAIVFMPKRDTWTW